VAKISRFLEVEVVFQGGINKDNNIMRIIEVFENVPLLLARTIIGKDADL
jgi:hypothetical protein